MIIRISGDGQYQIDETVPEQLNAVDDDLEDAVQARDQERLAETAGDLATNALITA